MTTETDIVHNIEKLAVNAWPPHTQIIFDSWNLRATFGVTKRANSVHTIGPIPENKDWLNIIEQFYKEKSITPCFYISEISPSELDVILEEKGYDKCDPSFIMQAPCEKILKNAIPDHAWIIQSSSEIETAWIKHLIHLSEASPDKYEAYSHILSAIKPMKHFISIYAGNQIVGMGSVVVENGWGCISNIVVDKNYRRKGIAVQLVRHLTAWALTNDASHVYLQVVAENQAALHLYNKLGFQIVSEYHFRVLVGS
ncbi:GNAT family N-acetyltransferase [Oceanobacillus jeddahense]|uniref:GNAT family N-acetyltransferase n=1 Tax=Oceanobacillus jeddahense TaxID=1462527 RepID=UPI003639FFD6